MSIKNYLKLYKTHKKPRSLDFYLLENFKVIQELLQTHSAEVMALFFSSKFFTNEPAFFANYSHIPQQVLKPSELEHFSALSTNQQIIAVVRKAIVPTYQGHQGLALVLENIQNPSNLGAIIRNAKWFGVRYIFCSPNSVNLYNSKAIQASMGTHIGLNIYYRPLIPLLKSFPESSIIASAISPIIKYEAKQSPLSSSIFLIMGNESQGISQELQALATHFMHIPKFENAESLNVAVANGILLQQILGSKIILQTR